MITYFLLFLLGYITAQPLIMQVTIVNTWGCDKSIPAQQFKYDGTIKTVNTPNRCLDWNGNNWVVFLCNGGWSQQYEYNPTTKFIRIPKTNVCLTPTATTNGKEQYGSPAIFKPCDGSKSQQWTVTQEGQIESVLLPGICVDYASTWQCDDPNSLIAKFPMCNNNLPSAERAKDLVSRMTIAEKYAQMIHDTPAITRLGVKNYLYWSEALHGTLSYVDVTTMFPQIIGMGAGFNQSMFREMGNIISTEARAIWNANIGALTFFAPNINIFRDPRWGRGQETPGEDPLLTSTYAVNLMQGMQGSEKYTKVVGTCKHFAAYSLESWNGVTRFDLDAIVDARDQEETYMPAFKSCVTVSQARSVMCSYNSVNGFPACASPYLLQQKLRDEWGFKGFVVSDCNAVLTIFENHHFTTTKYNASAIALKAGTDLNCGYYYLNLPQAMSSGLIKESDLNQALERVYAERFDLGMFNRASNPYEKITWAEINTKKSQDTSLRAAQESIVLLKNNNRTLPLDRTKIKTIAVIGPNAASSDVMKGNYFGVPPYIVTALAGITESFGSKNVIYAKGCDIDSQDKGGFAEASEAAKKADVIVMVMGITIDIEKEGLDRYNLTLPGMQSPLIQAVKSVADGKPIIVVLLNGGPLDVSDIKNDNAIGAIVEAWYGGQSGGAAIGNVLFGDYNPGGVLPVTFYANNYTTQIKMTDMNMRPFPGRTYRYLQVPSVYSFGHGLSYTKFDIKVESESVRMFRSSRNAVRVSVRNVGDRDGDFVALAFAKHASDDFTHEDGALASFDRVHVKAGQKQVTTLYFNDQSFERFRNGKMVALSDAFTITIRGTQHSNVEQFKVYVH